MAEEGRKWALLLEKRYFVTVAQSMREETKLHDVSRFTCRKGDKAEKESLIPLESKTVFEEVGWESEYQR